MVTPANLPGSAQGSGCRVEQFSCLGTISDPQPFRSLLKAPPSPALVLLLQMFPSPAAVPGCGAGAVVLQCQEEPRVTLTVSQCPQGEVTLTFLRVAVTGSSLP